jgi:hypothetical protein
MAARTVIAAMAAACLRGDHADAAVLVEELDDDGDVVGEAVVLVAEQVELLAEEQGINLAVHADGAWASVLSYTSALRSGDMAVVAKARESFSHMSSVEVAIAAAVTVAGLLQVRDEDRAATLAQELCLREALAEQ